MSSRVIIGIDVGGSTTKIVGLRDEKMISPLMVKANDPKASIYGAFGKFLDDNRLRLGDIDRIMVTGVGSSALEDDIYGICADKVDEFRAIGRGGLYLSGLDKAIIVSMGTGTAIISARGREARHVIGTGVGGGTLLGLSKKMLGMDDIRHIMFRQELYRRFTVDKLMVEAPCRLSVNDSMEVVIRKFDDTGAWNLPVDDADGRYLGFVSKSKVFASYRQMLVDFSEE